MNYKIVVSVWKDSINTSLYVRRISVAEVVRAGAGAARLLAGLAVRTARRQAATQQHH